LEIAPDIEHEHTVCPCSRRNESVLTLQGLQIVARPAATQLVFDFSKQGRGEQTGEAGHFQQGGRSMYCSLEKFSKSLFGLLGEQVRVHWMKAPCVNGTESEFDCQISVSGKLEGKKEEFRVLVNDNTYGYFKIGDVSAVMDARSVGHKFKCGDAAVIYLGSHPVGKDHEDINVISVLEVEEELVDEVEGIESCEVTRGPNYEPDPDLDSVKQIGGK